LKNVLATKVTEEEESFSVAPSKEKKISHISNTNFVPNDNYHFSLAKMPKSEAKWQKARTTSHKGSKAKNRLLKLRSQASVGTARDLVPNGQYSEVGFRDVRTNFEKERLLQWVEVYLDVAKSMRQMHIMRIMSFPCLKLVPHHLALHFYLRFLKSIPTFYHLQLLLQN
jgi:hypothetical protein